jgi:PAS domain S-box-containing protein
MSEAHPGCPPEDKARFLEQIAESMREIIWTSDATGKVLFYVNPAYEKVVGRPVSELYRNPASWHDLLHPEDRDRVELFVMDDEEGDSTEFRIVRPDGDVRWLWLHRTSVRGSVGELVGIVGVVEDITERKRAELGVRESESLLRATLDSTADGILVVNREGRVSGFNRQFLDLWNIPDAVAAHGEDHELITYVKDQLSDPESFVAKVRELYRSPDSESFDVLTFRDGRVFERYSRPQRLDGTIVGRVWSFRDVSKRVKAEASVRMRNRRLDIQTQVLLDLARRNVRHGSELSAVLPDITEAAAEMLDTERVGIWVFDKAHSKIRLIELYERSRRLHSAGMELERDSYPAYFAAMELERTIAANDARTDKRTREFAGSYLEPLGITSMLDAPIRAGVGLRGVVCFEHKGAPRRWSVEDRTFAGSVADLVSLSIEAAELQRSEDGVHLLLRASRILASSLSYRTTLSNVARLAVPTLADWCIVSVIEDGVLKRVAMAHVDPEKERIIAELEQSYPEARSSTPAVHVIRTGEPEFVPEVTEELMGERTMDAGHRRLIEELGARSYMAIPLVARGATLGAITFASGGRIHDAQDLALAKDIATRSAIAIDNAQLHANITEANRVKSNFLSVMSHELRTPLAAITGYAGLLEEGIPDPATPAQKEHLARLRTSAIDLLRMIDEILDFSRIGNGDARVHVEEVELGALIEEVAATGAALANEHHLKFSVRAPQSPMRVRTDPATVRQILVELLSNAVKFTRHGRIELRVSLEAGAATFEVSDTGPGIPVGLREKVFEAFYQAEDVLTREVGGTGIGLAVARGLARCLGGDVTVAASSPGRGTTFRLTIPEKPPEGGEVEAAAPCKTRKQAVG